MEDINPRDNETGDVNTENSFRLTEWAKEPSIQDLKQDYLDAETDRSAYVLKVDQWLDNLHVINTAKRKKIKGRSNHVPKLIRKQAEWRYAALSEPFLSTDDIFNVYPVTYEDVKSAEQNQLVLNNQINTKINKVKFIDEYVRACVNEGTVFVKLGWNFVEEPRMETRYDVQYIPVQTQEQMMEFQKCAQLAQQDPITFDQTKEDHWKQALQMTAQMGQPIYPLVVGEYEEEVMKTVANHPTLEICDYKNMTVDPSCKGDLDKAGFIIYSFETSLAELKKDGRYSNLDRINIENAEILGAEDTNLSHHEEETSFNYSDKLRKKIIAYEYWGFRDIDGSETLKPIVATWVGNTLIRMEENPFPDKCLPFVSVQYLPVKESVYGEPDGELLKENQEIVGALTRGMIDIMGRSANGQMGYRKDALDITNRRKFMNGQDYEYNGGIDPRLAFHMHTYPEIPQSAQYMLNMQNLDAESMSGVKAFSGGQGLSGAALGDNVGGIKSALDATAKRELGILRRLAEGMKKIGHKIISMNAEFLDEEEVIRITNAEFVKVRRDDLAGKFDLRLDISTAEADDAKAQELAFMLQTLGPNGDFGAAQLILSKIAKLRKMPDLAQQIETYQPQPTPVEQMEMQKLQMEIEKMKAEIAKLYSEARENDAEAELDIAKAQDAKSAADLKNLDFLEQESGVKQERDLEKQGEQARANMELEYVKSQLNKGDSKQGQTNN